MYILFLKLSTNIRFLVAHSIGTKRIKMLRTTLIFEDLEFLSYHSHMFFVISLRLQELNFCAKFCAQEFG